MQITGVFRKVLVLMAVLGLVLCASLAAVGYVLADQSDLQSMFSGFSDAGTNNIRVQADRWVVAAVTLIAYMFAVVRRGSYVTAGIPILFLFVTLTSLISYYNQPMRYLGESYAILTGFFKAGRYMYLFALVLFTLNAAFLWVSSRPKIEPDGELM